MATAKATLYVIKGDITTLKVAAIVNAANESLLGGGGVDGAIHRAAGPGLLKECRKLGACPTGEVRMTKGYELPARYVLHTVGPIWRGGNAGEPALLAACYRNCLTAAAAELSLPDLAFPAISCGVYGYPAAQAVKIAVQTCKTYASGMHITFVCFDEAMLQIYREQLRATGEKN